MAFPSVTPSLASVLAQLQNTAVMIKSVGQANLILLQNGSVSTVWVFQLLDNLNSVIGTLNTLGATTGLNAYATANLPGYAGTMTTDITSVANAAQVCINWVVANFPVDSSGFLQGFKLNADGSRTVATFTSAQTVGLQTAIQSLITSIG